MKYIWRVKLKKRLVIIEIGSNNTKTHVYEGDKELEDITTTIEFKKNYNNNKEVSKSDLKKLYEVIEKAKEYTDNIHIYGCSIFRSMTKKELNNINKELNDKYNLKIKVVSQEEEANYTALGCFANIKYRGNICIYINGGGSIELVLVRNGKIIDRKYYGFGVVDITKQFPSLKEDIPTCTFNEVYNYIDGLMKDINFKSNVFILAGGDHLYWYDNARYKLLKNTIYKVNNQPYMLNKKMNDEYDRNALITSMDKIRARSDNPPWFDGSRATKVITNYISHIINAKYIIPTKINMADGIKSALETQGE